MRLITPPRLHAGARKAQQPPNDGKRDDAEPGSITGVNPNICRTFSTICFFAGIMSVLLSIGIWWFLDRDTAESQAHAERFGIFVGLWAPTLLILSNRFDRYADKARTLPGLDRSLDRHDEVGL